MIDSLIMDPIQREIKLKTKRLAQSEKEKPIKSFFTRRFFHGWNKVRINVETEKNKEEK